MQRRLTIAQLAEASNRLANAFLGLGLRPGHRVAYVAQNHVEYVVLEFALLKAGLVKVPLNFRFAPMELRRCLELADVRLVVADDVAAERPGRAFSTRATCSRSIIGARDGLAVLRRGSSRVALRHGYRCRSRRTTSTTSGSARARPDVPRASPISHRGCAGGDPRKHLGP